MCDCEALCLALEEGSDRDHSAVSVKRGEQIVDHVSRELSRKVRHFLRCAWRASDVCPAKSFAKVMDLTGSYRFVGMIMMVPQQTMLLCKFFFAEKLNIQGTPICFLASLFMLSLIHASLISGHPRIPR